MLFRSDRSGRYGIYMSMTKRAVVTGGAGFIGSHLVDALIEKGFDVHAVDNLSGGKRENVNLNATLHVVDIRDFEAIRTIIDGADYVFHMAALPKIQYSIDFPHEANAVNIQGTLNVLDSARLAKVKRFVYSASCAVYGNHKTLPLHEDLTPMPVSPYGFQKYAGEVYSRIYADIHGTPTVSLRYFNVYGPRASLDGDYSLVIGAFGKQKKAGKPLTITGDGEQTRDFTHVRDVVRALILAAESDKVGNGESINIGAGNPVTINQLAALFGGAVEHIPARKEARHSQADNSKAKTLLGWEPTIALDEGLKELKRDWGVK